MLLFTNAGTDCNLHLSFCQWPRDNSKVLVFGYLKSELDVHEPPLSSSVPCYITVTAVPSLNGCKECIKVAAVSIELAFLKVLMTSTLSSFIYLELRRGRISCGLEFLCQAFLFGARIYDSYII